MADHPQETPDRRKSLFAVVALIGLAIVGYAVLASQPNTSRNDWPAEFSGDGERLYFTGRDASSERMIPRGGNHHRTMMGGGGCVDCHGTDRQGGRLLPTFWQKAPPLTAQALAEDHGDDGHGHDSYTAETLAVAITDGVRPDGSTIGAGMPRWSMSGQSLDAIVNYLLSH